MSLRVHRNLNLTTVPSDTIYGYDEEPAYDTNVYNQKLEELQKYKSPSNLFYDIDTLFLTLGTIKREYNMQWKTHQSYTKKISSFLQSGHKPIPPPLQDISLFVEELDKIETKFTNWIHKICNKSHQILQAHHSKNDTDESLFSISSSETSTSVSITVPLMQKRNTAPNPVSNKLHKTSSTSTNIYRSKSKNNLKDRNIRPSHAKRLSQTYINKETNHEKKRKTKKNKKKRKTIHVNTNISRQKPLLYKSASIVSNQSSIDSVGSSSSRNSIIRSFGDLYENEFIESTARTYAKRIPQLEMIVDVDEKSNEIVSYRASNKQLKMVQYYASHIYGKNELFQSVFGARPVIYCDWMETGKSLRCIEHYLCTEMMTLYGKHHDNITITGSQTSTYQQEARSIILESVQGQIEQDVVLFCGNGSADCIYKMANILKQSFIDCGNQYTQDCFVVFVSVYECDSNILIWKEMGCKIVVIDENEDGMIDLQSLESKLILYSAHKLLIGSFTAASNITGVILPIDKITRLLHKYNALSFWDYCVAGPSMDILMTCIDNPSSSKDAIFISTHKYLGGPQTPGILCAKKKLFNNFVPVIPGNGTTFISYGYEDHEYEYLDNIEEREQVGTNNVIGCVRASLCFLMKDYLSTQFIIDRENRYLNCLLLQLQSIPNLTILGTSTMNNIDYDKLPIISMMISHSQKKFDRCKTKYLHYNFIAALMNDLFGIQGRGGMFSAGKYALKCMSISDEEMIDAVQQIKEDQNEVARPGFYRINLHYTLNKEELSYIVNAIKYICKNGFYFLPLYDVNTQTGYFYHTNIDKYTKKNKRSLLDISFDEKNGRMVWKKKHLRMNDKALQDNFNKYFKMADDILNNLQKQPFKNEVNIDNNSWYWLPSHLYDDCIVEGFGLI